MAIEAGESAAQGDRNRAMGPFGPDSFLAWPAGAQWLAWLAVICVVKQDTILEPPVWDAAMGVFPPAIELYRSGFDIQGLLQMGNWWTGGPNVHSLSLYTWCVAAVMTVTGSATATFASLHLFTFGLVAWSVVRLGQTLRASGVAASTVLAASACLLCLPLVAVQVGYLYTETWVMAASVLGWAAWSEGAAARAIAWAVLALSVKMTGIAIGACLGGVLVLRMLAGRRTGREWMLLPVLPIAVLVVRGLGGWLGAVPTPGPRWGDAETLARSLWARLGAIPDVTLLLAIGAAAGAALVVMRLRAADGDGTAIGRLHALAGDDPRRGGELVCLAMPAVFCASVVATVFGQILFLPRYLLPALPFALGALALLARKLDGERALTAVLGVIAVLGVLNWNGRFYTPEHVTFSVVERSHAYQDYHAVQRALIDAVADAPHALPVFVSKELDYMLSDPMMGYVETPPARVESLYHPHWVGRELDAYPDEFLLAYSNPGHGGEVAGRLLDAARARPDVSIRSRVFEQNGFKTALFWISRAPVAMAPGDGRGDRTTAGPPS